MGSLRNAAGIAGLLLVAACGDDDAKLDAPGPCWPLPSTPGGSVELGTGDIMFEPMPDVVPIVKNGSQSDPFIQIHSRIRGMPPGDPQDAFNPANPHTKVGAMIPDLGLDLTKNIECPASLGYVPSPEAGAFDLVHSLRAGFGTTPLADVGGKQVTITVEVVGSNGLYAIATKTATLETVDTGSDAGVDAPVDAP